jgi:hypothetical protein
LRSPGHFVCLGDGLDFLSDKIIDANLTIALMCHPGAQNLKMVFPFYSIIAKIQYALLTGAFPAMIYMI